MFVRVFDVYVQDINALIENAVQKGILLLIVLLCVIVGIDCIRNIKKKKKSDMRSKEECTEENEARND